MSLSYIARMFGNESFAIVEMEYAAPESYQPLSLCCVARRLKRSFWGNIQSLSCASEPEPQAKVDKTLAFCLGVWYQSLIWSAAECQSCQQPVGTIHVYVRCLLWGTRMRDLFGTCKNIKIFFACAVWRPFCRLAANPEFLGCGLLCAPRSFKEFDFWELDRLEFVWPYRGLPETGHGALLNDLILFESCHRTSC